MYVIVTNHVNWHRGNLQSDRENTGNLKMQFEWVPCTLYIVSKNRVIGSLIIPLGSISGSLARVSGNSF